MFGLAPQSQIQRLCSTRLFQNSGRTYIRQCGIGNTANITAAADIKKQSSPMTNDFAYITQVSQIDIPVVPSFCPMSVPFYDYDKNCWEIEILHHQGAFQDDELDTAAAVNEESRPGSSIRFRLINRDVAKNVPRNHLRYISWSAYLVKRHPKLESTLVSCRDRQTSRLVTNYAVKQPMDQREYSGYFGQDNAEDDPGVLMDTRVPVNEVLDKGHGYLFDKNKVRVQIEWTQSLLLFQSTYHKYDDLVRMQAYQMKKDIESLKMENSLLERRLNIFQSCSDEDNFD